MQKVINQFAQLGVDPRVTFFGNVKAGQDVTLSELRALFNGVRFVHCLATCKRTGHGFHVWPADLPVSVVQDQNQVECSKESCCVRRQGFT